MTRRWQHEPLNKRRNGRQLNWNPYAWRRSCRTATSISQIGHTTTCWTPKWLSANSQYSKIFILKYALRVMDMYQNRLVQIWLKSNMCDKLSTVICRVTRPFANMPCDTSVRKHDVRKPDYCKYDFTAKISRPMLLIGWWRWALNQWHSLLLQRCQISTIAVVTE